MVLAKVDIVVLEDKECGNHQRAKSFWERVIENFKQLLCVCVHDGGWSDRSKH